MMKLWFIFLTFWGVISINLGLFKVNVQIWKMFLGSLKFEYVLGMPDIPYILVNFKDLKNIWNFSNPQKILDVKKRP